MFSDRGFNDRYAQGDREQTPNRRVFVGISGRNIGNKRADQIMEAHETPRTVHKRHVKSDQDISQRMQAPVKSEQPADRVRQQAVQRHLPGDMPGAGSGADARPAKAFYADVAGTGPGKRIHFDQHGERSDGADRINSRADFDFDAFRDEVHRDHVDKKRLKRDVQIAQQREYLIARIVTQIDIDISDCL